MTGKNPGLSIKSVTAMGILLVLLLSFITYPFGFMGHGNRLVLNNQLLSWTVLKLQTRLVS